MFEIEIRCHTGSSWDVVRHEYFDDFTSAHRWMIDYNVSREDPQWWAHGPYPSIGPAGK